MDFENTSEVFLENLNFGLMFYGGILAAIAILFIVVVVLDVILKIKEKRIKYNDK